MNALDEGRLEDAIPMLKENIPILRDVDDPLATAVNFCRCARVLAFVGRAEEAARLLSCSETTFEEVGANMPWVERMNKATLTIIRRRLDEAAFAEEWVRGRALTADEAAVLALNGLE
jgi:hypothetical protein